MKRGYALALVLIGGLGASGLAANPASVGGGPFSTTNPPDPRSMPAGPTPPASEGLGQRHRVGGDWAGEAARAAALLNYFRYLHGTSNDVRQREYEGALARAEDTGLVGRLHLAMVELAREEPEGAARAASLLEREIEQADAAEQPLIDLAYLMVHVLRSIEAQNRHAARQAERAVRLEEKVKALISIEEGLRERLDQQERGQATPALSTSDSADGS
ncbi:hypothetical protein HUS23_01180 [Ectothiorhodospiraceae bacterium 2226]|nr:hypothetical protein HUS23_01180 [Ectothiorhodospiraceae bacterium 2226]